MNTRQKQEPINMHIHTKYIDIITMISKGLQYKLKQLNVIST